jgi:tetratricopeptide (TPR) repeat protein
VLGAPLSVKLGCKSWQQVAGIYNRDLSRGAFFLKTKKPPAKGTAMRIALALPSGTAVNLRGQIQAIYGEGEFEGRGPGIDIALEPIPQSVMWLLESALSAAGLAPEVSSEATAVPNAAEIPAIPSLEEGDEWMTAESDLVQALWQELTTMSKMNPFQLLGLPYDTSDNDIRSAFGAMSKKYHPDRFARYESFEIRELANEVFMILRDAYRDIADAASRNKYLSKLDSAATVSESKKSAGKGKDSGVHDSPTARPNANATIAAAAPKTRAVTEDPDDKMAAGVALLDQGDFRKALRIFSVEARKDGPCVEAKAAVEVTEGKMALEAGDRMEAAERFETALDIDPSNERAAQEIAEMRRQATSQRRGLLTKLMKKG